MIFNEIKCHVHTSLGLVGGCIPCIPPCVRTWPDGRPIPELWQPSVKVIFTLLKHSGTFTMMTLKRVILDDKLKTFNKKGWTWICIHASSMDSVA